jgi:hypothetical protein
MDASADEARLLFHKWTESAAPVRVRILDSLVIFDGVGVVQAFSDNALEIGGDSWQVTLPLTEAAYAFSDPREISIASVRETESARYELGLAVTLPSGGRVVLMELK